MRRSMIPWSERIPRTFEGFSRELEGLFERFFGGEGGAVSSTGFPATNVVETDDRYEVTIDLPGLKSDDVKVELQQGQLVVSGERKEEQQESGKTYHRVERISGTFRRSVRLPGAVDEAKIEANFRDGVLHVTLPKTEQQKPRQIQIRS